MVRVGATGGASKARMPEMNAQRLCRTQSQQSVHKEARTLCGARDYCLFARVVVMERVDATGGASKARMPEMNAQRLCRTQSQQSVHKEARMP